jgi:hypothetical protein
MDSDRNLLFGVLALQADLINPQQFAEVCAGWSTQKGRALADLLVERGWLTPALATKRTSADTALCKTSVTQGSAPNTQRQGRALAQVPNHIACPLTRGISTTVYNRGQVFPGACGPWLNTKPPYFRGFVKP